MNSNNSQFSCSDNAEQTPLHILAKRGQPIPQYFELFAAHGADLNAKDTDKV